MNENLIHTASNPEVKAANQSNVTKIDAREKSVPPVMPQKSAPLVSASEKRRERIRQLKARLEREESRDSEASRKERNGQLFVWGAMVEGVYRCGDDQERGLLRKWAEKYLTDKRHHQRAELGFARVEEEKAEGENA